MINNVLTNTLGKAEGLPIWLFLVMTSIEAQDLTLNQCGRTKSEYCDVQINRCPLVYTHLHTEFRKTSEVLCNVCFFSSL